MGCLFRTKQTFLRIFRAKYSLEFFWLSFFSIWAWIGCAAVASVAGAYAVVTKLKLHAAFAVYQNPFSPETLMFVCLSPTQYKELLSRMQNELNMKQLGYSCSYHDMKQGEVALVEMDVPFRTDRKEFTLQ